MSIPKLYPFPNPLAQKVYPSLFVTCILWITFGFLSGVAYNYEMLTVRQKQIFEFVEHKIEKTDVAPTHKEIARHFRLSSVATVSEHLTAIQEKGYLTRWRGHARAIAPTILQNKDPKKKEGSADSIGKILNKVIEGDCLKVMHQIPSKSLSMILCDLPYGTTQNHWDSIIPLGELWQHYERIIKDDGVIALTGQGLFTAQLMLSNQKLFKYKLAWIKSKSTNFLNAKKQPLRKHEDVCIFYRNQPKYSPQMSIGEPYDKGFRKNQLTGSYGDFNTVHVKSAGGRYPTDVVYFKTAESEGEVYHPTQKPIELGRYLIRSYTQPQDIVLDNACGSGSFLVSAIMENRRFIGIEKNEEVYLHRKQRTDYIEVCNRRIRAARQEAQSHLAL